MRTIVISCQKGGSGKTTATALLTVESERAGDGPAWLIDTDRQGSLSRWHEKRMTERPERFDVSLDRLDDALSAIASREGGKLCFIDMPRPYPTNRCHQRAS